MFYAGIDIAKRNHEASVIDAKGKQLLDSISITNTKEGCAKLSALFEKFEIAKDDVVIVMEVTGHYWLSIHERLTEQGYDVRVINPIQSEAFRKMYIRQTKNDSKDSFIIAQIMRFGQYSETTLSDENLVAMRQLSCFRFALVDNCGDCKCRILERIDCIRHNRRKNKLLYEEKHYETHIRGRQYCLRWLDFNTREFIKPT